MGDVGNLIGQAFGAKGSAAEEQKKSDDLQVRRSQMLDTYGQSDGIRDWINDADFKPHYDPIDGSSFGELDATSKATLQSVNTARAKWNDISDSERAIATDNQKQLTLDFEKRTKESQALQQASRIMDQREAASKAIGSKGSPGKQILTGEPSIYGAPTTGAKTLLGL